MFLDPILIMTIWRLLLAMAGLIVLYTEITQARDTISSEDGEFFYDGLAGIKLIFLRLTWVFKYPWYALSAF